MYRNIPDFLTDWKYESDSMLALMKNLTDESLTKVVHPNVRTFGFLSWHIIHTLQEMPSKMGLKIDIKEQQDYSNETVKEIYETFEKAARLVGEAVKNNWTDADLTKEDNMYGDNWKRGTTLSILIKHQAHHRAEMVVLMRILGLPVIGAYGPVKEDWAKYGMPTMN